MEERRGKNQGGRMRGKGTGGRRGRERGRDNRVRKEEARIEEEGRKSER